MRFKFGIWAILACGCAGAGATPDAHGGAAIEGSSRVGESDARGADGGKPALGIERAGGGTGDPGGSGGTFAADGGSSPGAAIPPAGGGPGAGPATSAAGRGAAGAGSVAGSAAAASGGMPKAPGSGGSNASVLAAGSGSAATPAPSISCTRNGLRALVDRYFEALAAHDPTRLPLAPRVKFTQNAQALELGAGLWSAAGQASALRSAFDPQTCQSFTAAIVERPNSPADQPSGPAIVGVRLKLKSGELSEVESYVVLNTGVFFSAAGFADAATRSWEAQLPAGQRVGRDVLVATGTAYLDALGNAPSMVRYDAACERWDNGQPADRCDNTSAATLNPLPVTQGRVPVVDVESGVVVATGLYDVSIPGFAMLKVPGGQLRLADIGVAYVSQGATSSGWE